MFRDVLEAIPVRVFWKDLDGKYLGCNRLFAADAGRADPDSLIGEDDFAMGWAAQAPLYRADDRRVIERGVPKLNYEEPQTTPDGRTIWLRTSKIPLRDGQGRLYGVLGVYEDITERKRAELDLRESERRFDQIARQSRTYIWEVDADGLYTFATPGVEDILGYKPGDLVGNMHFYDLHPGEGREAFKTSVFEVFRRRESFKDFNNIATTRDGRLVWLSTNGFPLLNPDGSLRGYRGSDLDVTERKQAEERAARRALQLQNLLSALQEINSTLDVSVIMHRLVVFAMDVTDASSGAAGLMVEGQMVFTEYNKGGLTHPIDYRFGPGAGVPGWVMQTRLPYVSSDATCDPHVDPDVQRALSFCTLVDVPIILRDGRLIGCFEIHNKRGGPFDDSDVEMLKGLAAGAAIALENAEHLRSQKQAEERMREALSRLQATVDALPDLLFEVDREGRIYDYHAPRMDLLYKPPGDFVGKKMGDVLPAPVGAIVNAAIAEALATGRHKGAIYSLETPAGRHWFELSIAVQGDLRTDGGRLILLAHDITDLKQGEEALRQTAEDLKRSNRDLEQMAFVAAHDLKEPLRMVTSFLDLLQRTCGDTLDEKGRECIAYSMEGGKRMQNLVEDLLRFAQVGRQKVAVPTDLGAVLRAVCVNLQQAIEESGAAITHDPLPMVQGNPEEMVQLLQNLVGNAIKFRGNRNPEIRIGAQPRGEHWLLSVRDNGMGFDPRYAERIFVIFQRLHTREAFPGTGIGLAICKKIVEQHGGAIWAESTPGEGATFFFTLPQTKRSPA